MAGAIRELSGDLTFATVAAMPPLDATTRELDFTAVSSVDSAGLALLVLWVGEATRRRQSLSVRALPDQLQRLIRVYALESFFPVASP